MQSESCGICGGDGRISNSFGLTTRCPSCHGTGRKEEGSSGIRDVTKTKASHHKPTNKVEAVAKPQWPVTFEGGKLATDVKESGHTSDVKARLIREIIEYEGTHGSCTQTFQKKVRKQIRPKA
jgi:DnaJ-class molecular chaperone